MQKLYISPTLTTPEINFSPDENIFLIRGNSSPEDVRATYYPVIDWFRQYTEDVLAGKVATFLPGKPLKFMIDLEYFNSSSAKFLYDIFTDLKRLTSSGIPFIIEWYFDKEDIDMKDAGYDISLLVGTEFNFIPKNK